MKRFIIDDLRKWKESKRRKPLILRGARQVGKTWILEEFGKEFVDVFVRINFDKETEYNQFFEKSKDIKRIIQNLSFACSKKITTNTLIIFDEIQACPEALNSLKYFCEDAPEYFICAAGSLLGLTLSEGFPVGKVDFLDMGPMTFEEFLLACGDDSLVDYLKSVEIIENIPNIFHDKLIEKLKMYFVIGGMPEAVKAWAIKEAIDNDIKEVDKILMSILDAYEADFGKHAPIYDVPKIRLIWDSLPSQLAKENKKFLYSAVKHGARAREYENALNWLKNADLIKKVSKITKPGLPIKAYEDLSAFKIYMNDVGLLRRMANLDSRIVVEGDKLFREFKGAFTENYILNMLNIVFDLVPNYFTFDRNEIDFVIQNKNKIIPIEVKSNKSTNNISLTKYSEKFDNELSIRFSMNNLAKDGKILNVPLFLIEYIEKFI